MQVNKVAASPQTLKKRQCFLPCGNSDDCQEKKCCLTDEDAVLLTSVKACHSRDLSQSHRSQSLVSFRGMKEKAESSPIPMKQMKSNPELTQQVQVQLEAQTGTPTDVPDIDPNQPAVPLPSVELKNDEDSSDDEIHHESKPMISSSDANVS
jgi:hypothetical protein